MKTKILIGSTVEMNCGVQNPKLVEWTVAKVTRGHVFLESTGYFPQKVAAELVKVLQVKQGK